MQVSAAIVAMRKTPEQHAEMVSQALHSEIVTLHHEEGEFGLIQNHTDGYVGWALMEALSAPALAPTHKLRTLRAYAFPDPTIKAPPFFPISLGVRLVSKDFREGRFLNVERIGWVVEDQLSPIDEFEIDPATVAEQYIHTPYLWGGRESLGIDCSGLVQQAFGACGVVLPRDSDMQAAWCGESISNWRAPGGLQRNDLVFWKGHVGIMLDAETLLHANAYHMATAIEPLHQSIDRIAKQYGEPLGARRINISAMQGLKPDWLTLREPGQ
jgi:hypothetical protein